MYEGSFTLCTLNFNFPFHKGHQVLDYGKSQPGTCNFCIYFVCFTSKTLAGIRNKFFFHSNSIILTEELNNTIFFIFKHGLLKPEFYLASTWSIFYGILYNIQNHLYSMTYILINIWTFYLFIIFNFNSLLFGNFFNQTINTERCICDICSGFNEFYFSAFKSRNFQNIINISKQCLF